jgi:hypothetical protein
MSSIRLSQKSFDGILKVLGQSCNIRQIIFQITEEVDEFLSNYPDKALLRLLQIDGHKPPPLYTNILLN